MKKEKIVILGAGLAGLSAAYQLENLKGNYQYQVFEKAEAPGGLSGSKKIDGFTFDLDGHLLHFKHPSSLELLQQLLAGRLIEHQRNSWVYSSGTYIPYPFQANLFGLPSAVAKSCLLPFIKALNNGSASSRETSFKDWLTQTFGQGIAEHFMLPYNRKFWTVPLEELTCEWLDGFIPVPTLDELSDGAISQNKKRYGYNASFWYPAKGGIEQVALAFAGRIKQVETSQEAKKIDLTRKRVVFQDGRDVEYDRLVSTIALPELAGLIDSLPESIEQALRNLRWTSIFNLNLGLERAGLSDKHWIYFPDEEFIFYRVGFPSNFSSCLTPPGKSSLYVEVSYSPERPLKRENLEQRIIEDLNQAGILSPQDKILVKDINDIKYGYVIYDKNRQAAVKDITDFLRQRQIFSLGRFGSWRYMSMEDVILQGKEITLKLRN